ncbi:MAG: hypothetical protein ACPGID_00315 [Rubricella sp.]
MKKAIAVLLGAFILTSAGAVMAEDEPEKKRNVSGGGWLNNGPELATYTFLPDN